MFTYSPIHALRTIACVQTSPISFVARGTKEIGDVCTQAMRTMDFQNTVHMTFILSCLLTCAVVHSNIKQTIKSGN